GEAAGFWEYWCCHFVGVSGFVLGRGGRGSTLFPYTTLFRSERGERGGFGRLRCGDVAGDVDSERGACGRDDVYGGSGDVGEGGRSEEDSGGVESRFDDGCRVAAEEECEVAGGWEEWCWQFGG